MPRTSPRRWETQDRLFLAAALAAVLTGAIVIAAGLTVPTGHAHPVVAAPSEVPRPIVHRLARTAREPSKPQPAAQPAHRPVVQPQTAPTAPAVLGPPQHPRSGDRGSVGAGARLDRESWQVAPAVVRPPEQSRSAELPAFEEWMRLEPDTRHFLTRLATLSRHAPPSSFAPGPKAKIDYPD